MEIKTKDVNGILLAELHGRIDSSVAKDFEQQFLKLVGQANGKLIADFANLDYISSAGLRVLLMAAKDMKNNNGKFVLCNMNDSIWEVFTVSGFIKILNIQKTLEQALGAF